MINVLILSARSLIHAFDRTEKIESSFEPLFLQSIDSLLSLQFVIKAFLQFVSLRWVWMLSVPRNSICLYFLGNRNWVNTDRSLESISSSVFVCTFSEIGLDEVWVNWVNTELVDLFDRTANSVVPKWNSSTHCLNCCFELISYLNL